MPELIPEKKVGRKRKLADVEDEDKIEPLVEEFEHEGELDEFYSSVEGK